jgi:ATP-dependent DNA ligase
MLAKPVSGMPAGCSYEPKWDGFRSIVFRDGDDIEIGSRNERPMTRYFPELVTAFLAELPQRCVVDGEIILVRDGRLDFEALQLRLHPAASRVTLLAGRTPAAFVAFDLLALEEANLMGEPFGRRRALLEQALRHARPPVFVTPATTDTEVAQRWFTQLEGAGLDGIIAKPLDGTYVPDKRTMFKVKHQRTADCVVAGYRVHKTDPEAIRFAAARPLRRGRLAGLDRSDRRLPDGRPQAPLPRASGTRHHLRRAPVELGRLRRVRQRDSVARRVAMERGQRSLVHPAAPERVVEARYDYMEGNRFRHTAQFVRWRPDRTPLSCTFDQLERPVTTEISSILPGLDTK